MDFMQAMPFTAQTLGAGGAIFDRFHAHTPVCCPSRCELLSGRYFHNIKNARPGDDADPDKLSCMHVNTENDSKPHAFPPGAERAGLLHRLLWQIPQRRRHEAYLPTHTRCPRAARAATGLLA